MDWDAISALGEAVSAVAIVITLVYLTAQLKQTNRAVRSSTFESYRAGAQALKDRGSPLLQAQSA